LTAQLDSLPTLFTARDHQLFALYLSRKFKGNTPELDRIMIRVENRIAAEAAFDFRVTDLYLQRIAFLLAAGRPDLVKPRWVERALTAQQSDRGGITTDMAGLRTRSPTHSPTSTRRPTPPLRECG
jgi:hypothetical protein